MLFKKKVTIDKMAQALYAYTVDEEPIKELNLMMHATTINKHTIKTELIFLKIFTIYRVLNSKKFKEKLGGKAIRLFECFIKHFKKDGE